MFEPQESTPWHQSITSLLAASLLLPPVGLVLLWMRRQTPTRTKLLGSLAIVLLGAGYFFAFSAWRKSSANEAHYAALEQHRAQQAAASGRATGGQRPGAGNRCSRAVTGRRRSAGARGCGLRRSRLRRTPRETTGPTFADLIAMAVTMRWQFDELAGAGIAAGLEATGRSRLRLVHDRRWTRLHHRTAAPAGSGCGLRHQHRPRTMDSGLECRIHRFDRRWATHDAHLGRRPAVCARRHRRASLSRCEDRSGKLGEEHSQRQSGAKSIVGHGCLAADRRRQGDRACRAAVGGKSVVAYNKLTGAPVWKFAE